MKIAIQGLALSLSGRSGLVLGLALSCVSVVRADFYALKKGETDLRSVSSYAKCTDVSQFTKDASWIDATTLPGSDDIVWFGWGGTSGTPRVWTIDEADNAVLSGFYGLCLYATEMTISCTTDTTLACAISGASTVSGVSRMGRLIKTGEGALSLTSFRRYVASNAATDYLFGELVVKAGVVRFYEGADNSAQSSAGFFGQWTIESGATVYVPRGANDQMFTTIAVDGFSGAGTIGYEGSARASNKAYQITLGMNSRETQYDFSGRISGPFSLLVYGRQDLSGKENGFDFGVYLRRDATGGGTVGYAGATTGASRADSSSLGVGTALYFRSDTDSSLAGVERSVRYVGQGGDILNKIIYFYAGATSVIDGGESGGLTIVGTSPTSGGYLYYNSGSSSNPGVGRLVFAGDGTKTNFVYGGLYSKSSDADIGTAPLSIVKRGKGTWALPNWNSGIVQQNGTYAVDEGTLQFRTMAPIGTICSLGLGTQTYDPDYVFLGSGYDRSKVVPWQVRVGNGTANEATLEYIGTTDVDNGDRVIAVNGAARIKNSSGRAFSKYGFVTAGSGVSALALEGVTAAGDITNRTGTLTVIKAGEGETKLERNLTFNGALKVEGGHLKIDNPDRFTWFKFIVKANMRSHMPDATSSFNTIRMNEFALFDAAGNNLVLNKLKRRQNLTTITDLKENEVAIVKGSEDASSNIEALFNGKIDPSSSSDPSVMRALYGYAGTSAGPAVQYPVGWFEFVIRLPDDTPAVTAYDYVSFGRGPEEKGGSTGAQAWYIAEPCAYELQGSVDGLDWKSLHEEKDGFNNRLTRSGTWASSDGALAMASVLCPSTRFTDFKTTLPAYPTALANVTSVSVGVQAGLTYVGAVAPIAGLEIDVSSGIGTIEGATLSAQGTVTFVNAPAHGAFSVDLGKAKFANPEALSDWTFMLGEKDVTEQMTIGRDRLVYNPRGLLIIFK